MAVLVSIIICTRNRAASLRDTIASIGASVLPAGIEAELLVVDNGSTDETARVVAEANPGCLTLRYIREETQGQCYARNRGLTEMRGQVALFTDDDVRVPSDWIVRMSQPILSGNADAVAGGVSIPAHLAQHLDIWGCWFASTDGIDGTQPSRMVGANMAFSSRVREKVRAFDLELGPGRLGFGDDTLFAFQLIEAGYRLVGALDVSVEHHFNSQRLTRRSFLEIASRMGRSEAYLSYHWRHSEIRKPLWQALRATARLTYWRVSGWRELCQAHGPVSWELQLATDHYFFWAYLKEMARPRNYRERGWVKLGGTAYSGRQPDEATKQIPLNSSPAV